MSMAEADLSLGIAAESSSAEPQEQATGSSIAQESTSNDSTKVETTQADTINEKTLENGDEKLRSVSGEVEQTRTTIDAEAEISSIDPELEAIKQRVREMEQEAERLKMLQQSVERDVAGTQPPSHAAPANFGGHVVGGHVFPTLDEKIEADARSIYVGQVDYGITAAELETHFRGCGAVNRVTILCDKFTGHPKGFCYVEFADKDSVETAMALDGSDLKGRILKVMPKRTNKPGISSTDRGRPRGRGRGRGGFRGRGRGAPGPIFRGRGRGRGAFAPY